MALSGTVRPATREDVPSIRAIYNEAILNTVGTVEYVPVSPESRMAWFDDRVSAGYPVLVFEAQEVLGFAALSPWVAREGYRYTAETAVYVSGKAWGQGIATQLLAALVEAARRRGYRNLVARVATENEASLRVHLRHGFREVGRMPELIYKFDRWFDVAMLQLRLVD